MLVVPRTGGDLLGCRSLSLKSKLMSMSPSHWTNRKKPVQGVVYRGCEERRKHNVLRSILCSTEDIKKTRILVNAAYARFKKVWSKNDISFDCKLKIYEAQIVLLCYVIVIAGQRQYIYLSI